MPKHKTKSVKILELPPDALANLSEFSNDQVDKPTTKSEDGSPYTVRDGCVYRKVEGNELRYIANFTTTPIEEILKDDGLEQTRGFVLKGRLFTGVELPRVSIPAGEFSSLAWIPKHWGMAPSISPSQTSISHYKAYIQGQALNIPSRTVFTHTGFRKIGGKLCYLHGGGALGVQGVECELEGDLSSYRFVPTSDISPQQAGHEVLELYKAAPAQNSYPLMAFTYLAPLTHFCGLAGIAPSFILYLLGESGSFKTALSMLYLSHFREYSGMSEAPPTNFHSTANAIEKTAFALKDMPLLVDDYHPSTAADRKRMDATAQRLARGAGDHISRGRMNADTTLKTSYTPRGLTMVTGEDIPDIGLSGLARFVFTRFEKGEIGTAQLTARQSNAAFYNVNMQNYILWVIERADTLPSELKRTFQTLVRAVEIEGSHARTAPNIAWLQLGIIMISEYLLHISVMDNQQVKKFRDDAWAIFVQAGKEQAIIQTEEKPANKFLSTLEELLSSKRKFTNDTYADADQRSSENLLGYHDNDYYYLYPDVTMAAIKRFYADSGDNFPVSKNRLFGDLAKIGLIETQDGRNTVQRRVGGINRRWLILRKSALRGDWNA